MVKVIASLLFTNKDTLLSITATEEQFPPQPCKEQSRGWRTRMLCRMYSCQGGTTLLKTTRSLIYCSLVLSHQQRGSGQSSLTSHVCVSGCSVTPSAVDWKTIRFAFTAILHNEIRELRTMSSIHTTDKNGKFCTFRLAVHYPFSLTNTWSGAKYFPKYLS